MLTMWVVAVSFAAGMATGMYVASAENRATAAQEERVDLHGDCRKRISELEKKVGTLQDQLQKTTNWWEDGDSNPLGDCSY